MGCLSISMLVALCQQQVGKYCTHHGPVLSPEEQLPLPDSLLEAGFSGDSVACKNTGFCFVNRHVSCSKQCSGFRLTLNTALTTFA